MWDNEIIGSLPNVAMEFTQENWRFWFCYETTAKHFLKLGNHVWNVMVASDKRDLKAKLILNLITMFETLNW